MLFKKLVDLGLCASMAEGRRAIQAGGVSINGEKIKSTNSNPTLVAGDVVRVGKTKEVVVEGLLHADELYTLRCENIEEVRNTFKDLVRDGYRWWDCSQTLQYMHNNLGSPQTFVISPFSRLIVELRVIS